MPYALSCETYRRGSWIQIWIKLRESGLFSYMLLMHSNFVDLVGFTCMRTLYFSNLSISRHT